MKTDMERIDEFRAKSPLPLVGENEEFLEALSLAAQFAPTEHPVLIVGESGTGKENLARATHANSHRAEHLFVALNCAAIPETLIESVLFGHERGAFTGAHSSRKGQFELARNGTLMLDEIAKMSPFCQDKLLRAIGNHEILPIGAEKVRVVQPRIICATSLSNLNRKRKEGKFIDELYYRISVAIIYLSPLRERQEDISLLAEHFLQQEDCHLHISPDAVKRLAQYHWPGNIRELEVVIKRAVVMAEGNEISPENIIFDHEILEPLTRREILNPAEAIRSLVKHLAETGNFTLWNLREEIIKEAVRYCKGNKSQAAKILGVSRDVVHGKTEESH